MLVGKEPLFSVKMKQLLLFLASVAVGSVPSSNPGLRAHFEYGKTPGVDCFYDIPRTIDGAIAQNWTMMSRPPSPHPELPMYCKQCTFCTFYDCDTGKIAGIQVAVPLNNFTGAPYPWNKQGYIPWKPCACAGVYMTKQMYFISEETLSKPVEERQEAALSNEVIQEQHVWVTDSNKKLMAIPTNIDEIEDIGFTRQACIPGMGLHHFYKMSSKTKCTAKTLLNWFTLTDNGKLIGIGFVTIGFLKTKPGELSYFEKPPKGGPKMSVPRGPKCIYKLADDPTLTTMHIYFVDEPWNIKCA